MHICRNTAGVWLLCKSEETLMAPAGFRAPTLNDLIRRFRAKWPKHQEVLTDPIKDKSDYNIAMAT
jgi:hypothetical protein